MLSWQIFPCIRVTIILKRQVLKNVSKISVIYSMGSGNPRHRRPKSLIFQGAAKEGTICLKTMRTPENANSIKAL